MTLSHFVTVLISSGLMCLLAGIATGWLLHDSRVRAATGMPADPVGLCTRANGHEGPCNGFPAEGCLEFADAPISRVPQRAENPVQRKTEIALFHRKDGTPVDAPHAWVEMARKHRGEIAYDELSPMFLDQFLLRYFPELMNPDIVALMCVDSSGAVTRPWDAFVSIATWAKDMPLLFEQLTGYKLNELQLNNAIAEYYRRLQKKPVQSAEIL